MEEITKKEFITALTSHRSFRCTICKSSKNPIELSGFDSGTDSIVEKPEDSPDWLTASRRSNRIVFSNSDVLWTGTPDTKNKYYRHGSVYFQLSKAEDTESYKYEQPYMIVGYYIKTV